MHESSAADLLPRVYCFLISFAQTLPIKLRQARGIEVSPAESWKAIKKARRGHNCLAYALKKFSAFMHVKHYRLTGQNQLENTQRNRYTDFVVAAGFSVFVGS